MKFLSSEATLFFGSSQILVVALKWLSVETLELLGSWSNMEFRRIQSCMGPLLYLLYTADIPAIFSKHSSSGHLYADDAQAFVHGPPSDQLALTGRIDALSQDLHLWMSSNRLSLNPNKTQFIWFSTPQQLSKLDLPLLTERFPSFTFHSSVRNLGVVLDSTLTFSEYVANLTRSSYFHLRRLRAIRRSVSSHVFTSIVHAFVCSRIDYCNSNLVGFPKVLLLLLSLL